MIKERQLLVTSVYSHGFVLRGDDKYARISPTRSMENVTVKKNWPEGVVR